MSEYRLSPSVNELAIAQFFKKDEDDPILQGLHSAVRTLREVATKAASTTEAVLRNEMESVAARQRKAAAANLTLRDKAAKPFDAALAAATTELATIAHKVKGPETANDPATAARKREIRERLSLLNDERRRTVINEAIKGNDELLLSAVLNETYWLSGFASPNDLEFIRANWQRQHCASELDRMERLEKAIASTKRIAHIATSFIDGLTNVEMIEQAEKTERAAVVALQSVRE